MLKVYIIAVRQPFHGPMQTSSSQATTYYNEDSTLAFTSFPFPKELISDSQWTIEDWVLRLLKALKNSPWTKKKESTTRVKDASRNPDKSSGNSQPMHGCPIQIDDFDLTCLERYGKFRCALSDIYDDGIDPYRWLLRELEEYALVQDDLRAYINLTAGNPSLFARHRLMRATTGTPEYYLGCAMNSCDLVGYLYFLGSEQSLADPDLLYFAAHCACQIVRILNKAGFVAVRDDLKRYLQVWRIALNQFQIRLGTPFFLQKLTPTSLISACSSLRWL